MLSERTHVAMIRARSLMGFEEIVTRHGGNPQRMLRACGIDPDRLANPANPISQRNVAQLIENTARELDLPDFGLQMAGYRDISVIGPAAVVVLNSPTLGDALTSLSRSIRYNNPSAIVVIEDQGNGLTRYCHDMRLDDDLPRRHMMEGTYCLFMRFLCLTTGDEGKNWQVEFRHAEGLSPAEYKQYFPCQVNLGCARDTIIFPSALLDTPLTNTNTALRAAAEQYMAHVERRYPLDTHRQVGEIVERLLTDGSAALARVADLMAVHPRTLQRRLQAQGVAFDQVLDEVRCKRAAELLASPVLPLAEVGLLCGYSGQVAFTLACRRWFGTTPGHYRKQNRSLYF